MRLRVLMLIILTLGLLSFYAFPVAAATITVDSTADNTTANDGDCTLREAIINANNDSDSTSGDCLAGSGVDFIGFGVTGTFTISSDLPTITDPVIIDGSSAAGANCQLQLTVILDGSGGASLGIWINNAGSGSTISGLVIQNFGNIGLILEGSSNNVIQCNFIGTDNFGASAAGNNLGIRIQGGSTNNIIGTDGNGVNDALEGNVISGNNTGILFISTGVGNNRLAGNKIGTDRTGAADLGNTSDGIVLQADGNIIGVNGDGSAGEANEGNVISGNNQYGVNIIFGDDNIVAGNFIGTDSNGTVDLGNSVDGISIDSSSGNIIGTNGDGLSDALERNLISGNDNNGIDISGSSGNSVAGNFIGTSNSSLTALANGNYGIELDSASTNNIIGTNGDGLSDTLERNIISGNTSAGVSINGNGTNNNRVAGNYIGTDFNGSSTVPNGTFGIEMHSNSASNIIGTNGDGLGDANEGNLISGNLVAGIFVTTTGTNNIIAANFIGTDNTGASALANGPFGIALQGGPNNNIIGTNGNGSSDTLEGNLISGHSTANILLADADDNRIAGNFIGTNASGSAAIASGIGIGIQNTSTGNIIGTNGDTISDALEGNLISGNNVGISIATDSPSNYIQANKIGTNAAGNAAVPNNIGIVVTSSNNRIGTNGDGSVDALEGNLISGNSSDGIQLNFSTAQNNTIAGNIIGLDASASAALANGQDGINLSSGASNNTIGGNLDAESNYIARNTAAGILIEGANSTNNIIDNNYIGTNLNWANLANGTNGISISATGSGTTTVSNNWIFYHTVSGILLSSAADLAGAGVSVNNCLYQNSAGVNNTTGLNTFFENNWWGSPTGPSGVGTGSGDSVSADVDYIAFLTLAPTGCPGLITVTATDPSAAENPLATGTFTFDLGAANPLAVPITITYTIAGTGTNGSDYATISGTIDILPGQQTATLTISPIDDLFAEGAETVEITLVSSSPSFAVDTTPAIVTIADDEVAAVIVTPINWTMLTGSSRTYDVYLSTEPSADVFITLTQLDANCTISTTVLIFTDSAGATPWNIPQQVTVTGVGAAGSICTIEHSPQGGGYDLVPADTVVVRLRDANSPTTSGEPVIVLFDPAISKIGFLEPGETGVTGEQLEWIVTVSNVSSVAGTNVTITDTLNPALQIDSVDAPGATVSIVGQSVTVVYPTLAIGQTVQFSIFTTVLSGATVENTACVNATNQGAEECATGLAVSELPNTGESPLWRYGLLMAIALLLGGTAARLLYKKPKTKKQ